MFSCTMEWDFPWLTSFSIEVSWKIPTALVETNSNNWRFSEVPFLSKKHHPFAIELYLSQFNASSLLMLKMYCIRNKAQCK